MKTYIEVVKEWRAWFLHLYKEHKFRKGFKSDFYQSILKSDRVSKKQLAIIKNMVSAKVESSDEWRAMITQEKIIIRQAKRNFYNRLHNNSEYLKYKNQIEKGFVEKKLADKKETPLGKLVLQYWEYKAA